ncbi:MAG TPA: hypothetical protein VF665_22770 [Longimicrobium sp.]|jgi:hypothetical protein|uniref:hypothetical protein n=1 Tax=Longimicrobium sp. TaxID=2029185 RepID=UPI002ED84AC3
MVDRVRRTEPDRLLEWKVGLFFAGALLLMAGMLTARTVLVMAAAVVLAVGAAMGLVDRVRRRRAEEAQWEQDEDDDAPR